MVRARAPEKAPKTDRATAPHPGDARKIRRAARCHVLSANDLVAAWGGLWIFREELHLEVGVMVGPATDNEVGVRYVTEELGVPAANARTSGARLADLVEQKTFSR